MLILGIWILTLTFTLSKQECSVKPCFDRAIPKALQHEIQFHCRNTNFENFLYDLLDTETDLCTHAARRYELFISDSNFVHIHLFLPPLPGILTKITLKNSSVETIENKAFEECKSVRFLDLSDNNLSNMSFIGSLPESLEGLSLRGNKFQIVEDVFYQLKNLNHLDLSNCEISLVNPNSFSNFRGCIFISLQNNSLSSFDVFFEDGLILGLDLSVNRIKSIDTRAKRISFSSLNASHNQIESFSYMSCQDCDYSYYRRAIKFIDFSFNDLKNITFFDSLDGAKLTNLYLSNSNIDENFNFEILKYATNTVYLNGNRMGNVSVNTFFGYNIALDNLNLFNSSISEISERGFSKFRLKILNLSSNPITELKNYTFQDSRIEVLDISRCLIQRIEANAFHKLHSTNTLDLSNNRLSSIFEGTFQALWRVKKIDLSNNFLKNIENYSFSNCSLLAILNLSNSSIEAIEKEAFADIRNLQVLNVQNNLISEINFQTTSVQEVLDLRNNAITDLDFSFLANSSSNFVNLAGNVLETLSSSTLTSAILAKEIDLSNSNISKVEHDAFVGLSTVEFLNLSHNCIEEILPKTFLSLRKLKQLDLADNNMTNFSNEAFPYGNLLNELNITFWGTNLTSHTFISLNNLKSLTLSNSRFELLEANCFKGLVRLENLYLDNVEVMNLSPGLFSGLNHLRNVDFHVFFKNVNEIKRGTFRGLPRLVALNLSNSDLTAIDSEAFVGLSATKILSLNNNQLKNIVNRTFVGLDLLQCLNLSSNHISVLHSEAFYGLFNLRKLILSQNYLTRLVLGTFQEFPKLEFLDLHGNYLNKLPIGTFSNLKSLVYLDLSFNNFTRLKMENFMTLISLTHLNVTGNHVIRLSHTELVKALPKLEFFGINDNKWKCHNLSTMLISLKNHNIQWFSAKKATLKKENIDGVKCFDICRFFYCADEEESLWQAS